MKKRDLVPKILQLILLVLYIFVWASFGIYYHYEANLSQGTKFIFQEDVSFKSKYAAFIDTVNFNIPEHMVKRIRIENEKRHQLKWLCNTQLTYYDIVTDAADNWLDTNKCNYVMFADDRPIGYAWRDYYYFKVASTKPVAFSIKKLEPMIVVTDETAGSSRQLSRFVLVVYKDTKSNTLSNKTPSSVENLVEVGEYTVYLDNDNLNKYQWYNSSAIYFAISNIGDMFADSLLFPDNDVRHLVKVFSGKYTYPMAEFLYFSAVTITTLGYGDILPNDTNIRIAVMLETFMGLFLIGCFISSLFVKKSETSNSKPLIPAKHRFRPIPPPKYRKW